MTYRYPTDYLVKPIVNLNGTSREALIDQQQDVVCAADVMIKAMANAMPHPRDYQLQGPGTYEAARNAYLARVDLLTKIRAEIEQYALDIATEVR